MPVEDAPLRLTASPELAAAELRRLRFKGLRSPKDHVIVELLRMVLVIVPCGLWLMGYIGTPVVLGYMLGYFGLRWFEKFVKPRALARFGPRQWRSRAPEPAVIMFDSFGLHSLARAQEIRLGWSTVPYSKVGDGIIFRIGPEMSIPVTQSILPEDWTMERFEAAVDRWQAAAASGQTLSEIQSD